MPSKISKKSKSVCTRSSTRIIRHMPQGGKSIENWTESDECKLMKELPEDLLARFEPLHVFGEGGMAWLLLGRQRSLRRDVMIKVLQKGDPIRRQRALSNEARVLASLDHPGVLPIIDAGNEWIAMKWIRGSDLSSIVRLPAEGNALSHLMRAIVSVTLALEHAHSKGVIHRDLKPDNMVIGQNHEAQIIDWGLAISFRPDDMGNWIATPIHECGHICAGTLGFLAPEIVRGRIGDIGPASDTAQIGACLYEILTGTPPFLGRDQIESLQLSSRGSFVPILERNPRAPPYLANIAQRCLHITPEVRRWK